ncbi:MAG: hypothetical protein M1839_004334 [Geoglossum umbratile]|nr:MAG: hypothetical protein M1839_004334 [Geoglossum umbratile]
MSGAVAAKKGSITIAWITDDPTGRGIAEELLDSREWEPLDFARQKDDMNAYSWGRIGEHNIVIVAPAKQSTPASKVVNSLLTAFPHVKFGVFVGAASGYPNFRNGQDVHLGDIVVAHGDGESGGLVQYDLGTAQNEGFCKEEDILDPPPVVLLEALNELHQDYTADNSTFPERFQYSAPKNSIERLFKSNYAHVGGESCDGCSSDEIFVRIQRDLKRPKVFHGIIAAGNDVVRDTATRSMIEKYTGKGCICFDTKVAGLMSSFPCIVIQGISRYADSHKNSKKWYYYASSTAAAYVKLFLSRLKALEIEEMKPAIAALKIEAVPSRQWNPDICKRCSNLQCPPGLDEYELFLPARRFLQNYGKECRYCLILCRLWIILVKNWTKSFTPEEYIYQSELHIQLQRGKGLVVGLGQRKVPKAPGSPTTRADWDDYRRWDWVPKEDKFYHEDGLYEEMSNNIQLLDLDNPISREYIDLNFNTLLDSPEVSPQLCICYLASGSKFLNLQPDIGTEDDWKDNIGSERSFELIREFVTDCGREAGKTHRNCTPPQDTPLPTRVLDVRDGKIKLWTTPTGALGQYCTLSYRWGLPQFNYKTTRDNFEKMQCSVPSDELPPLIRDAVTVTRRLDISYLWIDALCIIQGDDIDWSNECPRMGYYYQNAYITICPSSAEDVRQSFIKPRRPVKHLTIANIMKRRNMQRDSLWRLKYTEDEMKEPVYNEPVIISFAIPDEDEDGPTPSPTTFLFDFGESKVKSKARRNVRCKGKANSKGKVKWKVESEGGEEDFEEEEEEEEKEDFEEEEDFERDENFKEEKDFEEEEDFERDENFKKEQVDNDGKKVILYARRPSTSRHASLMAASPLAERGWTWQENVLSSRIAHFTDWEIVFECRSKLRFEYTGDLDIKIGLARSFAEFRSNPESSWKHHVSGFSEKVLTQESDRLPAISGIAQSFSSILKGPYLAGLWVDWLDTDLLWYPVKMETDFDFGMAPLAKPRDDAPSWSWTSMKAKVRFPVLEMAGSRQLKLIDSSYRPKSINPFGPAEPMASITLQGKIFYARLEAENAFKLAKYGLRLPPNIHNAVSKLQLRPDGVLRGRVSETDPAWQTADRLFEVLSKLSEEEITKRKEERDQDFNRTVDDILALEEGASLPYFCTTPEQYTERFILKDRFFSALFETGPPRPTLKCSNVLCLLLTEHVAKNFPEPFTDSELKLHHINLEYDDPYKIMMGWDIITRTDGRSTTPGPPVLNQWYLILGYDKNPMPTCWRVGILNLQLNQRVELEEAIIKLT